MELSEESCRKIKEIMSEMDCPRDFECYKSNFEDLCEAVLMGDGKLVECVAHQAGHCKFALPFGAGHLCGCKLRLYIARTYQK